MYTPGEILKALRIQNNMTLSELADDLNKNYNTNLNKSMISKWEANKISPTYKHLKNLSLYYKITVDCILGFDENDLPINVTEILSTSKKRIRKSKDDYILDSIVTLLRDSDFSNRDLLSIKDFVSFLNYQKYN